MLNNALVWAQQFVDISHEDKNIIQTAKNTLLYSNGNPLTKKNADSPHDVTMGSFDGAKTCELIGLYCLSQLQELNINVGLYCDDGLCVSQLTRRQNDMLKQRIRNIFQDNGFNVDIECNKTAVDFLDVTLDLQRNIFKPYAKPNEVIQYVNKQSNYPPHVHKNIPKGINTQHSMLSSDKTIFDNAARPYQEALEKSGYDFKLEFDNNVPKKPSWMNVSRKTVHFQRCSIGIMLS